jgi:hypothetical protein
VWADGLPLKVGLEDIKASLLPGIAALAEQQPPVGEQCCQIVLK